MSDMTVAVTRPGPGAGPLTEQLMAAGARVVTVPLIAILPPSDGGTALRAVARRLPEFEWIVLTSANGVEALKPVLSAAIPCPPRLAAVGVATAEGLAGLGRRADLVPADHNSDGLAAEMPSPGSNPRLLVVQAEQPATDLDATLTARGWEVERVAAYRTVPVEPGESELAALVAADVITLASPSAATNLARLGITDVPAVCIGPTTTSAARAVGIRVAGTASEPTPASFTRAVVAAVGLEA